MSNKLEKLERELKKNDTKIQEILTSSPTDPIWGDEVFWTKKWIYIVDRSCDLIERIHEHTLNSH